MCVCVIKVLALADRAMEAVDLALNEESEVGLHELPTRVRQLTDHQRLVCQHAVDTLNDMLDVAKMENRTYLPKTEVIDLGQLCLKAAKLQSPRMREGVTLSLQVPDCDTVYVISDSVLLIQYLSNLLSNAAKFTSSGGVVLVCSVKSIGKSWLEVTLGVADSGKGIHPKEQRHVLRAFSTGDELPQEDVVAQTKSTGIGLRLADLIAQTIAEPSLRALVDCDRGVATKETATLRIESPLNANNERHVTGGGPGSFIYFRNALQLASEDAIERYRANPDDVMKAEEHVDAHGFNVEFSGTLRVLIVDDQRTMRQMAAMLYQKIAVLYSGVDVICYTAVSGEQAVRMCRKHRFHIITMDQQMSSEYCSRLLEERRDSERPDIEMIPQFVTFGGDNVANAKKRQAYFKTDRWIHDIQPGDGELLGSDAIRQIRLEVEKESRPPTLLFNLTGNLLEEDKMLFLEVGSSGMLSKPTKLEDMLALLQRKMGNFISQGLLELLEDKVVMDGGAVQFGSRTAWAVEKKEEDDDSCKFARPWAGGAKIFSSREPSSESSSEPRGFFPSALQYKVIRRRDSVDEY